MIPQDRRRSTYFQLTRSPQYSFVFAIPLLLAYEGFALFLNHSDLYGIRNSADVFLKLFLAYVGIHGFFGFGAAILLAFFLFRYLGGGPRLGPLRIGFFGLMLGESLVYSLLLGSVVARVTHMLLAQPLSLSRPAQVLVSLGAGIYEEFVFRVLLLTILIFLLQRLLRFQHLVASGVAALLGALLFSAFHYIGPFGDVFYIPSFLFRFVAGLVLTGLYLARGYGVTAYTHSLYDLWVTFGII